MMGANKITAAVVVLVAICVASFVAVRQLAKGEQINNPTIIANQTVSQQTSQPVQDITTATAPTTTLPATQPSTETTAPVETSASTESIFTTYEVPSSIPEIPTSIVNPVTTTTTLPTQTSVSLPPITSAQAPVTTKKPASTDPYIEQASKENDGFMGYMYNETGNYYYTNNDPWQRVFGFNAAYDFGAQFVFMYFDTARIKYTYNNKDWMIEFWKGQYGGVFIGAEIGAYYKPVDRTIEHYDCVSDDDALFMEMTLYRNGDELLTREYTRYWWCTGFVPGKLKKYSDRSELNLKARITMENKKMLKAFVEGLNTCKEFKFVEGRNYRVEGLDVFINW